MGSLRDKKRRDKHLDYFKCLKIPLKPIVKNPEISIPKITSAVVVCNKIVINSLMFMRSYLVSYFKKNNSLPIIDKRFVNLCMKVMCIEGINEKPLEKEVRELKEQLIAYYNTDFKPYIQEEVLDYTHLNNVLDYLTISIITKYENNIKLYYVEYVERYIKITWKKRDTIKKIKEQHSDITTQTNLIKDFCKQLKKMKLDVLDVSNEYKSDEKYHSWIKNVKKFITPNKNKYQKDNLYDDLQCNPQDYLPCMIRMMIEVEKEGVGMISRVFPMRNDIIHHSIQLDTQTSVLRLLLAFSILLPIIQSLNITIEELTPHMFQSYDEMNILVENTLL